MKTVGISPKAILAFCFPFIGTAVGVLIDLVADGHWDGTTLRIGVAGLLASALAALGAYVGNPGSVISKLPAPKSTFRKGAL